MASRRDRGTTLQKKANLKHLETKHPYIINIPAFLKIFGESLPPKSEGRPIFFTEEKTGRTRVACAGQRLCQKADSSWSPVVRLRCPQLFARSSLIPLRSSE